MSAAMSYLLGCVLLSPVMGPVPEDPPPDPLGRGYLGATFDRTSDASQLVVSAVQPGHPAAKAGILGGDEIIRVGAFHPQTFDQLVTHICSYRPGAVVEIEVKRGSERKVFRLALTTRPLDADTNRVPQPNPFGPDN